MAKRSGGKNPDRYIRGSVSLLDSHVRALPQLSPFSREHAHPLQESQRPPGFVVFPHPAHQPQFLFRPHTTLVHLALTDPFPQPTTHLPTLPRLGNHAACLRPPIPVYLLPIVRSGNTYRNKLLAAPRTRRDRLALAATSVTA
ncbi:hypothetical protein chiPu_0007901 [Chiloscyllium punctatum]|uniref:Uncharacterized protein n=1 Tax=Chiloscyllium punctatum TaxID=137246 RepID=A0A401SGC0_CHIPU|nr:hypothetical protein [Chiloscyllium punctatum]